MKVLLVIDMQNDFVYGALGTKEATLIVENVIEKIENFKGKIFFTKDTHFKDYLNTREGRFLPVEHCIKETEGWEIVDGVYDGISEIVEKNTFGSFDLVEKLRKLDEVEKIESIELIGICTDICVLSNAILVKTAFPEIDIVVDTKCCAGVTPNTHNNSIEAMRMCQILIV